MKCANCGSDFNGKFCPFCGQKKKTNVLLRVVVVMAAVISLALIIPEVAFQLYRQSILNKLPAYEVNNITLYATQLEVSNGTAHGRPSPGYEFVYPHVMIENQADIPVYLSIPNTAAFFDGQFYPESHTAEWAAETWESFTGELEPGETVSGQLAFEVPKGWKTAVFYVRVPQVDAIISFEAENLS